MKDHLNNFIKYSQISANDLETSMVKLKDLTSNNRSTFKEIASPVEGVTQATVAQAENTEDTVRKIDDLAKDIDDLFENVTRFRNICEQLKNEISVFKIE